MNISRRKRMVISLGLLISAVMLFFTFRDVQPAQFRDSLQSVDVSLLLLAVLVYFLAVAVIALRWHFLLRAVQRVPLVSLIQIVAIGYMGNTLYPLRAGEAFRVWLLRRNHHVPVARATTTILVERAFDGMVMLTFVLLGILLLDVPAPEIKTIASVTAPLFIGATLVFFFLAAQANRWRRLLKLLLKIVPQKSAAIISNISEDMLAGLEGLRSPLDLLGAVVCSFLTWCLEASIYWIVMFAFGLEASYPLALLMTGAVNLAGLIPASPGQVGIFEFVVSAILIASGTAAETAVAIAVVIHIIVALPVTVAGFASLVHQGLGRADISAAREPLQPKRS